MEHVHVNLLEFFLSKIKFFEFRKIIQNNGVESNENVEDKKCRDVGEKGRLKIMLLGLVEELQ